MASAVRQSMSEARSAYATRAERAYVAMQRRFCTPAGLYRRDRVLHSPGAAAHLWPFVRALVATLDLSGVPTELLSGFDAEAAIAQRLDTLERYWDPAGEVPAYSSDVLGTRRRGERYYDDNAWVGLGLIQLERLRPGRGRLQRAADLFRFAVAGWDRRREVPSPGGVFWVEQGRGVGAGNHDRNTVSNAPNAELGLHLAELTGQPPAELSGQPPAELSGQPTAAPTGVPAGAAGAAGSIGPQQMYDWINATLDTAAESGEPATGLFWDKVRGDGTIDKALWSYNQGSMVGVNVLLHRCAATGSGARYLARAEAIAFKALRRYDGHYDAQPPAFNAIFFRNLLLLHSVTGDAELRARILQALGGYADRAWSSRRDRSDLFHFRSGGVTLLDQSAMVQLLALLAWDPAEYPRLA